MDSGLPLANASAESHAHWVYRGTVVLVPVDTSGATRLGLPWPGAWPWPRAGGSHGTQALVSLLVAERIHVDVYFPAGDEDAADAAAPEASLLEGTPDPLRFRRLVARSCTFALPQCVPLPSSGTYEDLCCRATHSPSPVSRQVLKPAACRGPCPRRSTPRRSPTKRGASLVQCLPRLL